jgi:hypothetical protein
MSEVEGREVKGKRPKKHELAEKTDWNYFTPAANPQFL